MRAPIVSYKHQKEEATSYVGGDASNITALYFGAAPGTIGTQDVIGAGHKVYSVDVSVNFVSGTGSITSEYNWMLVHLRQDQDIATLFAAVKPADWTNIGLSNGRNQVIKSFIGLVGTEDAGPLKQNLHIKIPKLWHRVREGDQLVLVFNATAAGSLVIGYRYKDYS